MQALTLAAVRKRISDAARWRAIEQRVAARQAMAKARLDEGTFQGPIIPIGLIPEEPSVRVRAKRTIEEETKFFQLPPPEARPAALPAAGEATSSSTEAAPSPPPEAAIPPVETDTVRTAADVLSHHVGEPPSECLSGGPWQTTS